VRDVILVLLFAVALPLMVWRPPVGALTWALFALMNPQRLTWGFAYSLPFSQLIIGATLLGMLFSREPKKVKGGAAAIVLFLFVCYMAVTTLFALNPTYATPMLERSVKIQIGTFLALLLLYKKEHVIALMWVIAISIGFYAIKGGRLHNPHARRRPRLGPARNLHLRQQRLRARDRDVDPGLGLPVHAVQREQVGALGNPGRNRAVGAVRARQPVARRAAGDCGHGGIPVGQESPEAAHRPGDCVAGGGTCRVHAGGVVRPDVHDPRVPAGRIGDRTDGSMDDALQPGVGAPVPWRGVRALRALDFRDLYNPGYSRTH
jgi:hypothetical protein